MCIVEDAKDILQLEELSHDEMMLLHENYSRKYPDNRIPNKKGSPSI